MKAMGRLVVVVALLMTFAVAESLAAGPAGKGRAGGGHGPAIHGGGGPGGRTVKPPAGGGGAVAPRPSGRPAGPPGPLGNPTAGPAWPHSQGNPAGHGPATGPANWPSGRNPAIANQVNWSQWQQQAVQVRNDIHNRYDYLFTPQWYRDHPYAWQATHPHADAWAAASWTAVAAWVGATVAQPMGYGYGSSVVYGGDTVYVNGEETTPVDAFNQQAADLAQSGNDATQDNGDWLPLGVFTLAAGGQTTGDRMIQLAVAKNGTLRGTYFDTISHQDLPVQGSVDKQTQRAAWTVGSNTQTVMETTLENLTKDEAPLWVHLGKDRTQNWLLIRMKPQPAAGTSP